MSRRDRQKAMEAAAQAASEAGRTLQAQRSFEPEPEATPEAPSESEVIIKRDPADNPRNKMMEEVVGRRAAENGETAYEAPAEETAKIEPVAAEPAVAATEPPQPAEIAPEPVKMVRVKVDGKEFDAPEDEVNEAGGIKPYQILKASENRLKMSNEALAQARQTQAAMAQWAEQQRQAAQPPQKTTDQFIQEQVDVIRYGSPEESAAALKAVLDRTSQKVDQNQIIGQAVSVMQQQQAENSFVQEFSDIVHNPLLLKLIINLKEERIRVNQGRINDWPTFYRSIGNEVRGAIGRPNQPATAPASATTTGSTSTVTSDKEARKASIVNLPTAAARAALPEADKPETRADILQQMRKSRGLPPG